MYDHIWYKIICAWISVDFEHLRTKPYRSTSKNPGRPRISAHSASSRDYAPSALSASSFSRSAERGFAGGPWLASSPRGVAKLRGFVGSSRITRKLERANINIISTGVFALWLLFLGSFDVNTSDSSDSAFSIYNLMKKIEAWQLQRDLKHPGDDIEFESIRNAYEILLNFIN